MKNEDKDQGSRIRTGEAAPERPVHANPSIGDASTPATKGYRAIACPYCDYTTGIMQWSPYGEQNARGALVSHLVRKKHGMSRALAKEAARTAAIVPLTIIIESVLLETDVPDIVVARDAVNAVYLCCLVSRNDDGDRFLALPISSRRLTAFRSGAMDLRSVLLTPETGVQYDGRFARIDGLPGLTLTPIAAIPEEWLPEEGFLLTEFAGHVEQSTVLREAQAKNAAVIECHFEPPESQGADLRFRRIILLDALIGDTP